MRSYWILDMYITFQWMSKSYPFTYIFQRMRSYWILDTWITRCCEKLATLGIFWIIEQLVAVNYLLMIWASQQKEVWSLVGYFPVIPLWKVLQIQETDTNKLRLLYSSIPANMYTCYQSKFCLYINKISMCIFLKVDVYLCRRPRISIAMEMNFLPLNNWTPIIADSL